MALLDSGIEEPKSKTLRYVITGVAFVLLLTWGLWFFFLRFWPEKHTVEHFMNALVAGDTQRAYQIWRPRANFSYQDFLSFWGPNGYYSPIKSYRIEAAELPPGGGSGVIVVLEISGYSPFPSPDDVIKAGQNRETMIWVERSDQSLSLPPP